MSTSSLLRSMPGRQRLVNAFIDFTRNTSLAAQAREKELLQQFVYGDLTIDEVVAALEVSAAEK